MNQLTLLLPHGIMQASIEAETLPKGTVMAIRPEALAKLKELGIE